MAEALGRLISATLRFGNHRPAKERAREIVDQLHGIGGAGSVGLGINKVRSLPDAVAKAMAMHFGLASVNPPASLGARNQQSTINKQQETKELNILAKQEVIENLSPAKRDLCPSCGAGALVFEEGCSKCYACGYAKC